MESFGVLDLHFTAYTQKPLQHIMGLIHHYRTLVSISLEEQESLEGHSLYPFSLLVYDRCFLFDIRYQQDMVLPSTLPVLCLLIVPE